MNTLFEKVFGKVMEKLSTNIVIQTLGNGFMTILPITLGVAIIAVLGNLPIAPWQAFLKNIGMYQVAQDMISLTLSLIAIYLVGALAYRYTMAKRGKEGIIVAVIAMASFISLIPIYTSQSGDAYLATNYLGSNGIFVAMIVGIVTAWAYCKLMSLKITIKLPDSVPPNVSESLAPTFVVMIILTATFFLKYILSLTPYGNIFDFIIKIVQTPVMHIGTSPFAVLGFELFVTLLWFFGIHPNTMNSILFPIIMTAMSANVAALSAGKPLPYLYIQVIYSMVIIGGQGNTLSLCFATLLGKSEKYKALRKLVIPANIFNINEPVIFGFPLMLNIIYLAPMILTTLFNGVVAILFCRFVPFNFNPGVYLPWVTPGFINAFLCGGGLYLLLWVICFAGDILIYLPFFKYDDQRMVEQEKAISEK